eukprot:13297361-Ditylum_brightwellii.AAC.1
MDKDDSTLLEFDDSSSNASTSLSEAAVSATVIGSAYGFQSFGSVMPEVATPVEEPLSCENGTSSGTQSGTKGVVTNIIILPALDVTTPVTANTQTVSVIGYVVSSMGAGDGDSIGGESPNLFSVHHPRINRFLNHNKSSYDQGYNSDGNLPFWDPVAAEEDPETSPVSLPTH